MPTNFFFKLPGAPGDAAVYSAAFHDLKQQNPGTLLHIQTHYPAMFENTGLSHKISVRDSNTKLIVLNQLPYAKSVTDQVSHEHAVAAAHRELSERTKLRCDVHRHIPYLVIADAERDRLQETRPFVVIAPGHRTDTPVKAWSTEQWQELVNRLNEIGLLCVQIGHVKKDHVNPPLQGVVNLVGKTSLRELFVLIERCQLVICHVSAPMHFAAAFAKPCVVLAGSREPRIWEAYDTPHIPVPHRYLDSFDTVCCASKPGQGCWQHRFVPLKDRRDDLDSRLCIKPVFQNDTVSAACMVQISVERVLSEVLSYQPHVFNDKEVSPNFSFQVVEEPPAPVVTISQPDAPEFVVLHPAPEKPKLTIFICCYGDAFHLLHERCLSSIRKTTSEANVELRVAANQCGPKSFEIFEKHKVHLIYPDQMMRRKYPAMRQMFYDDANPIRTEWVAWFDDDSHVKHPNWFNHLMSTLPSVPAEYGMLGAKFFVPLAQPKNGHDPLDWFKKAAWWNNAWLHNNQIKAVPNGRNVLFATGGHWLLRADLIKKLQIPDKRLNHNGGDVTIGAQLTQGGYQIYEYNSKKEWVETSGAPRRGYREDFPWRK